MDDVKTINKVKINDVQMRVHPDFRDFVLDIINERIMNEVDKKVDERTCREITIAMMNFFVANPKIRKLIEEVEING